MDRPTSIPGIRRHKRQVSMLSDMFSALKFQNMHLWYICMQKLALYDNNRWYVLCMLVSDAGKVPKLRNLLQ